MKKLKLDIIKALGGDESHYLKALTSDSSDILAQIVARKTNKNFIKTKPGRGGKDVKYVTGGYITRALNLAFSVTGWGFEAEIVDALTTDACIVVKGRLSIYRQDSFKEQYGSHDRKRNVPVGDIVKAAATDALKKCASLFGIAGDVYGQIEEQTSKAIEEERGAFLSREQIESALADISIQMTKGEDVKKRLASAKFFVEKTNYNDLKVLLASIQKQYEKGLKASKTKA